MIREKEIPKGSKSPFSDSHQVGDLFLWISMHYWRRPRSAGPTGGAAGAVRAVANGAHERRRNLWAAPARRPPARQNSLAAAPATMLLNKGKSAAPGVGHCNAMKGLTIMSCPAQTEENTRDCLKITRRHFSWGQHEVGHPPTWLHDKTFAAKQESVLTSLSRCAC